MRRWPRWPEAECVDDWSQGIPLANTHELVEYWADGYDWRAREAALNRFDQFNTEIDGLDIHFIHQRSAHVDAFPLVITHAPPASRPSPGRSSARLAAGASPATTSPTGRRCRAAGTSRRSNNRSCSSTTSARSSPASANGVNDREAESDAAEQLRPQSSIAHSDLLGVLQCVTNAFDNPRCVGLA